MLSTLFSLFKRFFFNRLFRPPPLTQRRDIVSDVPRAEVRLGSCELKEGSFDVAFALSERRVTLGPLNIRCESGAVNLPARLPFSYLRHPVAARSRNINSHFPRVNPNRKEILRSSVMSQ